MIETKLKHEELLKIVEHRMQAIFNEVEMLADLLNQLHFNTDSYTVIVPDLLS